MKVKLVSIMILLLLMHYKSKSQIDTKSTKKERKITLNTSSLLTFTKKALSFKTVKLTVKPN